MGGQVPLMFDGSVTARPLIAANRVRLLAVATQARLPEFPAVPTFAELGFPDFVYTGWYSLQAPPGTPEPVLARLSDAAVDTFKDPRTRELMLSHGIARAPGGKAALLARIERELPLHRELMRRAGLVPE